VLVAEAKVVPCGLNAGPHGCIRTMGLFDRPHYGFRFAMVTGAVVLSASSTPIRNANH
jgi:hypothetical protein